MRKFLKGLELPEETIDSIMGEYGLKTQKMKEENESLKNSIKEKDSEIEKFKQENPDDLRKQIETLNNEKTAWTSQKEELNKTISSIKLDKELSIGLINYKCKNVKAVKNLLDMDKISLDDKGVLNGFDEQIKSLKESDGYLFDDGVDVSKTGLEHNSNKSDNDELNKLRKAMGLKEKK